MDMNKQNWVNRTIFTGDNLDVLRGLNSESIDLVYLDPPFNSNKHYSAPIGSEAAGAGFKDAWTFEDTDAAWWGELADNHESLYRVIDAAGAVGGKGDKSYLIYMAMRLLELHRVLKETGSLYLHCDPTMSHSLKMMLDAIFEKKRFINEITWNYKGVGGKSHSHYERKHDVILFYFKSNDAYFDCPRQPLADSTIKRFKKYFDRDGKITYSRLKETNAGVFNSLKGIPKDLNRVWLDIERGAAQTDWWVDIPIVRLGKKQAIGYPTQKPLALLARIIKASCPQGGVVLDPFCGCATTCIAAEDLSRQWVGIDISPKAIELVKLRAEGRFSLFPVIHREDIPTRNVPPRSKNVKHTLFGNQEGLCVGCKVQFPYSNFTIDHIIPTSKGGADTNGNLQLLCNHCNSVKGDRPMEYLLAKLNEK